MKEPKDNARQADRAAEQETAERKQDYLIKFIPPEGDEIRSIRLSARALKWGAVSLAAGAMLFVGAFSYSVYSTFAARSSADEVRSLREVNSIQQEQLLQLSKKANALQDQLDQLKKLEDDLRRLSGAAPAANQAPGQQQTPDAGSDSGHDGQGGPLIRPDLNQVGQVLDQVEKGVEARRQSLLDLQQQLKERQGSLAPQAASGLSGSTMPGIWPARGTVTSPYGLRWNGSDFHPGIDIANDMGTPIVATADGVVTTAGWNDGGYGNMVDIDHGNGILTRYGHAMQVAVMAGQYVRRGQVIAYMGSTGFSTGPHVHYEVRINGQPVNPSSYLH